MIDAIIRWSLHNRAAILAGAIFLIGWGLYRTAMMPVDVFPDLTAPTVTVITEAHGMAPEETERLISFPIESALHGASGIRRVRSSTSVGVSVVWAEFEWGTDIYKARQIVAEKLQLAATALPPGISPPILAPISSIMGEILFIGLRSDNVPAHEVRTFADWNLRRRLLAVPGVSQVIPIGGGVSQIQVTVRPVDLVKHRVSLHDVVEALRDSNANTSAGFFNQGGQEYLIYGVGRVENLEDISRTVVNTRNGFPILVSDVASVEIGPGLQRGDAAINGDSAVVLGIQKQPEVNTLKLTQRLDKALDDIESSLPEGVTLERHLLRQADFIQAGVDNILHALRDGAILVVLIVGLFLMSRYATFITALAIPISLLVSILVLNAFGASLNVMTLGGMAIAVGALVDDAIIDVENVMRRLRQAITSSSSKSTLEIVFEASKEVRSSIVFATFIIVLVFLPLFFLEGVEGRLLEPLGVAYVVSLLASLVVALTITPVLCSLLLPKTLESSRGEEPRLIRRLRQSYEPVLERALSKWSMLTGVSMTAFIVSALIASNAGRSFLPEFNEGALTISVVTFPGTSLEQSNEIGKRVESILLGHPEVVITSRRTGRAELDEHAQGTHASEIDVRLSMKERDETEFLAALRTEFSTVSGTNIVIGQPISHRIDHMISGTRANVAVKIFGPSLSELRRLAERVRVEMAEVRGVVDLAVEQQAELPLATIRFNREALARHNLSVHELSKTVETVFTGQAVSQVLRGSYVFDLVVRYAPEARENLEAIRQTMIPTPHGAWVPLEALADIQKERGPNQISREQGERKIVVMCNIGDGRDLGSVVEAIQERISSNITFEPGYYVEYGGQFEAAEQASRTLVLLSIGVLFGVFFLLYSAFGRTRDAFLVMLNLPLALIGGVVGVLVSGGIISVASIIGFITLFGIATRNGIMLISHIRHLESRGTDARTAVLEGASERLVPILMTALASGLGLLPLALSSGEPGNEIQAPMAIVILFGLITSTVMNMFVVPALMLRFGGLSSKVSKAVEPALMHSSESG